MWPGMCVCVDTSRYCYLDWGLVRDVSLLEHHSQPDPTQRINCVEVHQRQAGSSFAVRHTRRTSHMTFGCFQTAVPLMYETKAGRLDRTARRQDRGKNFHTHHGFLSQLFQDLGQLRPEEANNHQTSMNRFPVPPTIVLVGSADQTQSCAGALETGSPHLCTCSLLLDSHNWQCEEPRYH